MIDETPSSKTSLSSHPLSSGETQASLPHPSDDESGSCLSLTARGKTSRFFLQESGEDM